MQSHGITLAFHPIAPGSAWQNGFTERLIGIDSSLKCASPKTTIWSTHSRRIADCHLHVSLIRIAVITFAQWAETVRAVRGSDRLCQETDESSARYNKRHISSGSGVNDIANTPEPSRLPWARRKALMSLKNLMIEAERVVVAEIVEGHPSPNGAATVAPQLTWHGLQAEPRTMTAEGHPVAASLSSAAEACSADLLVMGSYSTGPLREEIFGGCTRSILNHAPVPVFVL